MPHPSPFKEVCYPASRQAVDWQLRAAVPSESATFEPRPGSLLCSPQPILYKLGLPGSIRSAQHRIPLISVPELPVELVETCSDVNHGLKFFLPNPASILRLPFTAITAQSTSYTANSISGAELPRGAIDSKGRVSIFVSARKISMEIKQYLC